MYITTIPSSLWQKSMQRLDLDLSKMTSTGRVLFYMKALLGTGLKRMQEQNPAGKHEVWLKLLNRTAHGRIYGKGCVSSAV